MKTVFFMLSGDSNYTKHIAGILNLFINPMHSYAVFIWFAYVLFIVFAIVHLIKDKYIIWLFIFSIILYVFRAYMPGYMGIRQISKYTLYFIFPYFLLKEYSDNVRHMPAIFLIYPFLWAILTFFSTKLIKYKVFNFFNLLGKESDAIYYIHPFIIAILSVFLPNMLVYSTITGIAAICIPMLGYYLIERYELTFVGKLLYGKK